MKSIALTEQKNMLAKGYSRTSLGLLPNNWKIVKLSEYIESLDAGVSVNSEDYPANPPEKGILKTSAVNDGRFFPTENKLIKPNELHRAKLNPIKDSIIISRMNTPELVGEIGYVDKDYPHLFLPDRLWQTRYKGNVCGKWLAYLLTIPNLKRQIKNIATGTSNSMKNISKTAFLSLEVPLVPIKEQQKIADILSTWDKAIELKEKLIEQKKEQKKGLIQRLLTGKVRLPGFKGEWIKLKIKDLIKEVNDRTTQNNQYEVLSVTKNGIVPQREQFNKQIASEDNTGYKIVRRYNLVFSTMNLWMGSLDVLTTHDIGIVSPAYKVFEFIEQNINPLFGKYFMLSDYMIRIYKLNSEQGASIVRRNLDMDGLLSSIVSVPPVEEQLEISKVLQSADDELTLLNSELEALKQQKKGLMQLLLTGKVRVKC